MATLLDRTKDALQAFLTSNVRPAERRADPRYRASTRTLVRWNDGESNRSMTGRLVDISRGGAALEVVGKFPMTPWVRIKVGTEAPGDWIEADVLGVSPTEGGATRVRVRFRKKCSRSLLELAVLGQRRHRSTRHNPFAGIEVLEGRQMLSGGADGPPSSPPAEVATATGDTATGATLSEIVNDPFLDQVLYSTPNRMASGIADDGAVSVNARWENGEASTWYIENQRYGADFVQAGLVAGNNALVQQGWQILNWGFNKEAADGSFPGTGDAFHSTSMFVEAGARALLLEVQMKSPDAADHVAKYLPRLQASARWLMDPSVAAIGDANNAPYTHRRWLLAAALGEVGTLSGDPAMMAAAQAYALDGLALQTAEGMNPEKGGGDVSYQAYGILMAERYATVCSNAGLRARVLRMVTKGLQWDEQWISPAGAVSLVDSTRTGTETSRSGTTKTIDYKSMIQAFSLATTLTDDASYRDVAEALASGRGWRWK